MVRLIKRYICAFRRFRHHFRSLAVFSLRGNDVEKDEDRPRSGWSEHRGLGWAVGQEELCANCAEVLSSAVENWKKLSQFAPRSDGGIYDPRDASISEERRYIKRVRCSEVWYPLARSRLRAPGEIGPLINFRFRAGGGCEGLWKPLLQFFHLEQAEVRNFLGSQPAVRGETVALVTDSEA